MKYKRFKKFKEFKRNILKLAVPSSNPDNFTDLEDALDRIEYDLKVSLQTKGEEGKE